MMSFRYNYLMNKIDKDVLKMALLVVILVATNVMVNLVMPL